MYDADVREREIKWQEVGLGGICVLPDRRREFRPELVDELAEDMKAHGQLVPIILRPRGEGELGYHLIAGWHRLGAARKLKWNAIRLRAARTCRAVSMKALSFGAIAAQSA